MELPSSVFEHPEMLLPYHVVTRFFEEAARLNGIETLGARVGHAMSLEALGVFGRRVTSAATLGEALGNVALIAPNYYSGETFWLTQTGSELRLCHRFPARFDDWHQQTEQFSLCCALRLLRSVVAPRWQATIHFKKGMPRSVAELPMLRDSTIVFDQRTWAITFPRSLLHRPLSAPAIPPPTAAELDGWRASAPAHNFARRVSQVIGTALVSGKADIGLVASWIGMSVRTLQRRLKDQRISYAQLLAKARFDTAMCLLSDDAAPVHNIALKLGYSDPAHFTRAFRRWTGSAPRTIRQLQADHAMVRLAANDVHTFQPARFRPGQ